MLGNGDKAKHLWGYGLPMGLLWGSFFGVAIGIHVMGYNDIIMECNGDIIWDM